MSAVPEEKSVRPASNVPAQGPPCRLGLKGDHGAPDLAHPPDGRFPYHHPRAVHFVSRLHPYCTTTQAPYGPWVQPVTALPAATCGLEEFESHMAKLDDLIAQISDPKLRNQLEAAAVELRRRKKFGLVYEQHIPETTVLSAVDVKKGSVVMIRTEPQNKTRYVVDSLTGPKACISSGDELGSAVTLVDILKEGQCSPKGWKPCQRGSRLSSSVMSSVSPAEVI